MYNSELDWRELNVFAAKSKDDAMSDYITKVKQLQEAAAANW